MNKGDQEGFDGWTSQEFVQSHEGGRNVKFSEGCAVL